MAQSAASRTFLTDLRRRATKALASLRREITRRENELTVLREEANRWQNAIGRRASAVGGRGGARTAGARLDWKAVLAALPSSFTAKDVAQKSGKPMEQVYAGVSRWTKDKKVKKGKDGYQKM
jgi:hypothetical protein